MAVITHFAPFQLLLPDDLVEAGPAGTVVDLREVLTQTAPGSLQKSENLGDLDDGAEALTNLGGTEIGVDLFTAANAATARDAIGALAASGLNTLGDYADDAAAATGGVEVGEPYRTGSILKTRVA
jgi:hypothetical protein